MQLHSECAYVLIAVLQKDILIAYRAVRNCYALQMFDCKRIILVNGTCTIVAVLTECNICLVTEHVENLLIALHFQNWSNYTKMYGYRFTSPMQ